MTYSAKTMTIRMLVEENGMSEDWLRMIANSRSINRQYHIAWRKSPESPKSTIYFDTENLEKYRQAHCTGI